MAYSSGVRRFRGTKKRLQRIRWTAADRWFAALIVLMCLLVIAAGTWLGFTILTEQLNALPYANTRKLLQ